MRGMLEPRGYRAMLNLLHGRQAYKPSDTLRDLLEELALGSDGLPSDPVREEWNEAAKTAFSGSDESITQLHLD